MIRTLAASTLTLILATGAAFAQGNAPAVPAQSPETVADDPVCATLNAMDEPAKANFVQTYLANRAAGADAAMPNEPAMGANAQPGNAGAGNAAAQTDEVQMIIDGCAAAPDSTFSQVTRPAEGM